IRNGRFEDEILLPDFRFLRHHHRPFHSILQFAHVASPRLQLKKIHGRWSYARDLLIHRQRELPDKVVYQYRDIIATVTQRWQFDMEDVKAIVEIRAELAFVD